MPMPKYLLFPIAGACLFFSSLSPCAAQTYPSDMWAKELTWDLGAGNDDIPRPDFSSFSGDMSGAVVLDGFDLSGRDLRNARCHLKMGILSNIKFDNANLEGADFSETTFSNCSFRGANLKYTALTPSANCDMTDAILGGVRIQSHLTDEQMRSTWNFKNKDIIETMILDGMIKLEELSYNQLPLSYKNKAEHVFRTREFKQKSLHGLTITNTDFTDCDFSGFTFGFFENCNFQGANFKDVAILRSSSNTGLGMGPYGFRSCNISKTQIEQTRFWKETYR